MTSIASLSVSSLFALTTVVIKKGEHISLNSRQASLQLATSRLEPEETSSKIQDESSGGNLPKMVGDVVVAPLLQSSAAGGLGCSVTDWCIFAVLSVQPR